MDDGGIGRDDPSRILDDLGGIENGVWKQYSHVLPRARHRLPGEYQVGDPLIGRQLGQDLVDLRLRHRVADLATRQVDQQIVAIRAGIQQLIARRWYCGRHASRITCHAEHAIDEVIPDWA